jgi:hypothetical protein
MSEMTDGKSLALPESFIAIVLRQRGMDVRNDGVGSLIVNGQRWLIPSECTIGQAMEFIRERLSA